MENSAQTSENKPMPQDPKPGDDIQMHIETVIPEGENEIEATEDQNAASTKPQSETDTPEKEAIDNSDETAKEVEPTEEIAEADAETEGEKDDDATEATDESEELAKPSNDERDKIETISP